MAENIKVSVPEMQNTVRSYYTEKGNMVAASANLMKAVNALQATYEGPAAQAFYDKFAQFHKNFQESEAKMDDAINELNAGAQIYTQTELSDLQAAANGLDVGTSAFA